MYGSLLPLLKSEKCKSRVVHFALEFSPELKEWGEALLTDNLITYQQQLFKHFYCFGYYSQTEILLHFLSFWEHFIAKSLIKWRHVLSFSDKYIVIQIFVFIFPDVKWTHRILKVKNMKKMLYFRFHVECHLMPLNAFLMSSNPVNCNRIQIFTQMHF